MCQREVSRLEPVEISKHLVLGMIAIEHLVSQERTRSGQICWIGGADRLTKVANGKRQSLMADEHLHKAPDIVFSCGLVESDAERIVVMAAKIYTLVVGTYKNLLALGLRHSHANGIEKFFAAHFKPKLPQPSCEDHCKTVNTLSNSAQPFRPVIDCVHACHNGQENLGRADVACRFLTPDVLLPSLQCEAIGHAPGPIFGDTDDAPWHLSLVIFFRRKKCSVRSAESHRHAEPLAGPYGDIGPEFPRRTQKRERQQIG